MAAAPTPVDAVLFASLDPPRLAGSRCSACGCVVFPVQDGCPRCAGDDMATVELPDRGTLWAFTVQAFEPKPPYRAPAGGFVPYGVGYVDLGEVLVESLLVGDPDRLAMGVPMRLTLWDRGEPDGPMTYAFTAAVTG